MIRLFTLIALLALSVPAQAQSPFDIRDGRRALAFNLAEVVDWTTQQPFIDVFRTARPWIGHLRGTWGGREEPELRASGHVDEQGWVTGVPTDLTMISTLILTDIPAEMTSVAGRYLVTWEGTAYLGFSGAARNVRYGQNRASFEYTPGQGAVSIEFNRGSARNITVVHERNLARFANGEVFNPRWLELVGDAENLRFMDWMLTNNSPVVSWDERPRVDHATWMERGVPLEVMIELANVTGAEPWFTIPHLADDAYVRQFAEVVHARLRPDLRVWVEYSNEVWNFMFDQAHWAEEQARARWGREWLWIQFYAVRAAEVMGIVSDVFADAPDRVVRVVAVHTASLGLDEELLYAPDYLRENPAHRRPHESFDAYAITGYFSAELMGEDKRRLLPRWLAESRVMAERQADAQGLTGPARDAHIRTHRFDHALDLAGRELLDGSVTGNAVDSVRDNLARVFTHHARIARDHGMELVMYEGGTHAIVPIDMHDNPEMVEFFNALNYSDQMARAYTEMIAGWRQLTPAPFMAYYDVGLSGVWGSWGALRHLDDTNPRWDAMMQATQP